MLKKNKTEYNISQNDINSTKEHISVLLKKNTTKYKISRDDIKVYI